MIADIPPQEEEEAEPVQKVEQKSRSKSEVSSRDTQPGSNDVCMLCVEPPVVAKSTIVLDVKPWDTETGIGLLPTTCHK